MSFDEHKGAAGCCFSSHKMVDDVRDLLTLLCSPNCPHPYDGVVAGSVA